MLMECGIKTQNMDHACTASQCETDIRDES